MINLKKNIFDPNFTIETGSEFAAKLLLRIYKNVEELNQSRLELSKKYMKLLNQNKNVSIPRSTVDGVPGSLRFPVLIRNPNMVREIMRQPRAKRLGFSNMYPATLNAIKDVSFQVGSNLRIAQEIADSIITLPTHRHIQLADQRFRLTSEIVKFLQ
jgi:dTDP-4-amino-4,6-dideoxygalactose transaminase